MSYARFSSDDWRSNVYCFESCYGGIVVHVAANKTRGFVPPLLDFGWKPYGNWIDKVLKVIQSRVFYWSYKVQMFYVKHAPRKNIDHPHAGKSFEFETFEEAAVFLMELRRDGLYVPQRAIDLLIEDAQEAGTFK